MEKIPQPHGGALNRGGTLGNRGGKGAIPTRLRTMCREAWAEGIPRMAEIAKGEADGVSPGESVNAWKALGAFGVGELQAVQLENADIARVAVQLVAEMFGDQRVSEFADRLIDACMNAAEAEDDDDAGRPAGDPYE